MNFGQRRLARHQHERAALLQHYVRRALDQVVGKAARDRTQRSHRAGTDRHRVAGVRSRGDRRQPILAREHAELPLARPIALAQHADRFARLRGQREIAFLLRDDLRGRRIEKLNLRAGLEQALEQPQSVRHAGGAGERDRDRT